ncbi:GntR family transcriptional regulator [Pikeienuella sp. HZG-20]|uniref:GntR family transcriptional regulator n=1 Tax=Paludibacillus litoralis TaxID=3133267 RepID=UPI0030EBAC18
MDQRLERTEEALSSDAAAGERGASLTERAYRHLEEQIVTLRLKPGEVLSEAALAQRIGIGRTPVREALQRLAHEGMVVIMPRRGVMITKINIGEHLKLLEVRREVERLIARKAAKRASADERDEFREIAAALEIVAANEDDIGFMRLDQRFNSLLVEASRNDFAAGAMQLVHGLSRRFWYRHYQNVLDLPRCARLHKRVAEEVANGDEAASAAASDQLIDYIEEFARATI